jgi:hypothetical protein
MTFTITAHFLKNAQMESLSETYNKQDLFDLIKGTGKYSIFGGGLHTYPGKGQANQRLHDACVELENEGLIKRQIDELGYVFFVAK